jgi:mRNA interferase YafQ
MRAIERTSRFKRDYRRERSGVLSKRLDQLLIEAIDLLAADRPLPQRYFDHPLSGEWSGFRDCHIRPDLVLILREAGRAYAAPRPPRLAQRARILNQRRRCEAPPGVGGGLGVGEGEYIKRARQPPRLGMRLGVCNAGQHNRQARKK